MDSSEDGIEQLTAQVAAASGQRLGPDPHTNPDQTNPMYSQRLANHFALYDALADGEVPATLPVSPVPIVALLRSVLALEATGDKLTLLAPKLRADRIENTARSLGLDTATLAKVWSWWDHSGHKVR
jgi:hypothetical protein